MCGSTCGACRAPLGAHATQAHGAAPWQAATVVSVTIPFDAALVLLRDRIVPRVHFSKDPGG